MVKDFEIKKAVFKETAKYIKFVINQDRKNNYQYMCGLYYHDIYSNEASLLV